MLELALSHSGAHRGGTADSTWKKVDISIEWPWSKMLGLTSDGLEEVVGVVGSRPLLVREDVGANLALLALDDLDVGLHSVLESECDRVSRGAGVRSD